jgi:3-deoxy-D-manno-octulosonate 8-phosphate phosphatase KdsC-like HAD superfamily phosphatase
MKNKLILDFDGVFSADMLYTTEGKAMKSFPWGIRHSIDLLVQHEFEVYIITGDSTQFGQDISAKFTSNLAIKDIYFVKSHDKLTFLRDKFDLDECIYCGDDIYDIEIFKETYGVLPGGAHSIFKSFVDYISEYTTRDYFFMDMALHILRKFRYDNIDEVTFSEYIVKETGKRPFTDMLKDKRYKKVFILQQYSMRNHTDGKYNLLLDGNLNLTLHRIYEALKLKSGMKVTLTVPKNIDEHQFTLLEKFIHEVFPADSIDFIPIEYGLNAKENRDKFIDTSSIKDHYIDHDLIVSDFSGSRFSDLTPVVYNFNISQSAGLNRWFVDEYFERQMNATIECDEYIYVLNSGQRQFMMNKANSPILRKNIAATVIVDKKIIGKDLFNKQVKFFRSMMSIQYEYEISKSVKDIWFKYDHVFFLPFRLTDECYQFKKIVKLSEMSDRKVCIMITNPNDGDVLNDVSDNVQIINIAEEFPDVNKKSLYYEILTCIESINCSNEGEDDIFIPIFEDPSIVLHQSLIEMQLICPSAVNFISSKIKDPNFETLIKKMNNNYITKLTY